MISAQFVIAVMSSLTTAVLLWLTRQVVRLRNIGNNLAKEHRFLMASMFLVLSHLGMESIIKEFTDRK